MGGLSLFIGEVFLRVRGIHPYKSVTIPTRRVEPGGKLYSKDPLLGYTNRPGKLNVIYPTGLRVRFTNLPNHQRITRPLHTYGNKTQKEKPAVWLFGASFTYGDALNDEDTFAYLLQSRFPEYNIENFAVNGYGTVSSLLQFQRALAAGAKPRLAILVYAKFHDRRNTGLRYWQKILVHTNFLGVKTLPRARLGWDGSLKLSSAPLGYQEFPLMRHLALAHYLELYYNQFEIKWQRSRRVTEVIIETMADTARKHDVRFVVATLLHDFPMAKYLHGKGIEFSDITVDFQQPKFNNLPHDVHPNPLANQIYADRLEPVIGRLRSSNF